MKSYQIVPGTLMLAAALAACSSQAVVTEPQPSPSADPTDAAGPKVYTSQITEEAQARLLLDTAFSFDSTGLEPQIEEDEHQTSIRFDGAGEDFYLVEFSEHYDYPATVYHMDPAGTDPADDGWFDEGMIAVAQDFVSEVYGVDCAEAAVTAYSYGGKTAVELAPAEGGSFAVSFDGQSETPCGVRFATEAGAFRRAAERQFQVKDYL